MIPELSDGDDTEDEDDVNEIIPKLVDSDDSNDDDDEELRIQSEPRLDLDSEDRDDEKEGQDLLGEERVRISKAVTKYRRYGNDTEESDDEEEARLMS